MYEYHQASTALLDQIVEANKKVLPKAIAWMAKTIIEDRIIHTFGTGHSHIIGLELFVRAGGLANVNAFLDSIVMTSEGARRSAEIERIRGVSKVLWDQHHIETEDLFIVISNSGRNAMPIEMAERAKANGNKVIAITSIEQSKKYPVRIEGQKKLYEIADLVLDNCVPPGDGMLQIGFLLPGSASSIAVCFILNLLSPAAIFSSSSKVFFFPLYFSPHLDVFLPASLSFRYLNSISHL